MRQRLVQECIQTWIGVTYNVTLRNDDTPSLVRVQNMAAYEDKLIVIGRIVESPNDRNVGRKFVGSFAKVYQHYEEDPRMIAMRLTAGDIAYLTTPFDLNNPTTAHELSELTRLQSQ